MSTYTKEQLIARINQVTAINKYRISRDPDADGLAMDNELLAIALASLEAEPVGFIVRNKETGQFGSWMHSKADWFKDDGYEVLNAYIAPPAPVSVPEVAPVAYIFKHPAGRLFWSLTDESNKGQCDVMPVYSAPVPAFVPPVIEPDYEVIKGILPTANPDEYACCIAADMWNACRAAMLQGANGNSPVVPDGWVACSERMPDGMQTVITSNGFDIGQGWWDGEGWNSFDSHDVVPGEVTQWMPLPAAPQQK
ncbi:DUF551 domain-containing protein [Citrobacter sp. FP75]|uniref:DUF551 domain-containing protein n=1 Tax=Citrobacter sp. FP75 TaxID=1852949 RepID=UPI001BC9D7AE|nr:DUF551 domain-containing protein [Citrobacter sp. FP75]